MSGSENAGIENGRLKPCPGTPNCVSSQEADGSADMPPISYTGSRDEAHERLIDVIRSLPRCEIVTDDGSYIHAVCRSRIFGFADDVEFLFDDAAQVIHFRSAARVGYYDFGVNRKRMEEIRSQFERR